MARVVIPGFRKIEVSGGGEGGTTNYNELTNKPSINNVPLVGNLNTVDLKLTDKTLTEEGVPAEAKTVGAKLAEQSTSLTALSEQLGNHTVKSDVPENAVFTDTVYNDTDIKAEIAKKADATAIPSKISDLENDSNYQTAEQVNNTVVTEIAKVVADAPEDLNTLKEMSDWIAGHEDDASAMNSAISDNKTAITALQTGKADKSEIPTTLPANGGNSDTVNNHTVETDVPENAVFTDTIYDDTEVKGSIEELNSNLADLQYSDVAGGKNLFDKNSSENVEGWLINGIPNGENTYNQKTSHFIRIDGNTFVYNKGNENNQIAFYDSNKTFISEKYQVTDVNVITMPTNAKYVRVVYFDGEKDLVQIEKGTTATPYEPYIPSVKMLEEEVGKQNDSLSVIGKCKNLLNSTFDTYTSNGVTFTRNDDETYTLSGSCTDTSNASYVSIIENLPLEIGKYKITGALNENNYIRCIINVSGSANKNIYDYGKGIVLDINEANTTITLLIVSTDDTSQTRIVKPMLTTDLDATFDDFVPYTGDGDTLTHDVAKLKNDLAPKKN